MRQRRNEEERLRTVSRQTAESVFLARQRVEEELVRTKEALEQQARELSDYIENASIASHSLGPDGIILRANRAELSMLGYSREEYVGRHIAEFHVDRDVIEDVLRRLAAGETVRNREARMRCKDGSIKHVLLDSSVMWRGREFVHTRDFMLDNTDRRRAEEAHARLAAIVGSSDDAIISKTLGGIVVTWNAAAERLFGYTAEEAIGQSITIIVPPDRHDEERSILGRLRRGERLEHYETVRVQKDGRRIDVSLTLSPVLGPGGRVVAASTIAREITARKRAESRLATQYGVTRALADSGSLEEGASKVLQTICELINWDVGGLWYVDQNAHVLRCLELWHRPSLPIPQFEAESRHLTFAPGVGLPGWVWKNAEPVWIRDVAEQDYFPRAAVAKAEGLRGAFGFPIILNGQVLGLIELFSQEVRPPDENVLQLMTSIGSQIGQFVERKRAEVDNATLLETLREGDRRKDEFLAMLAHELRNPLAPIRTAAQVIAAKAPPVPELKWSVEVIDRQVRQMTRLIDDLLDVSRITRGKISLRKERIELAAVVSSAVEASRSIIEKGGHEFTLEMPPEPIVIDGDTARLSQVILNLLNNAAKYTDTGGRIWLIIERQVGHVVIRVKDTGIGIPADMLDEIFDMFTQVDRSLNRSEGGLGIGLTLVHRLVSLHGGSVSARSEGLGRGSEFVVRLPIAPATGNERPQEPTDGAVVEAAPPRRILIVDDNRDAADSLGRLLGIMGHEVRKANDGIEGVGAAASFHPHVVLLDIGLPRLNGYEVARRIRGQKGDSEPLLIAVTGWGQEEDRRRSEEVGFDYHMTKPIDVAALQRVIAVAGVASATPKGGSQGSE